MEIKVDGSDLLRWARYYEDMPRHVKRALARALNTFGEGVVRETVRMIADKNGWDADVVRSRLIVHEADEHDLEFVMDATAVVAPAQDWQRPWDQRDTTAFEQDSLVKIVTMDDGYDCDICKRIAEEGPYTMSEVLTMQAKWAEYVPPTPNIAPGPITNLVHPRAVLAGSTFASYGLVDEMVSAIFDGPAVRLATNVGVVTIGPNHPMLTRRGFISASQLTKNDQLLYDVRCKFADFQTGYPNFQQMMVVENVFSTLLLTGNQTHVFTSSHDFHGDRVFCQDKVDIVWPTRQLLNVLDPCGLEQFGKDFFMRADMQLPFKFDLSIVTALLKRITSRFRGFMSSQDLVLALLNGHALPFDCFLFGSGTQFDVPLMQDTINHRASDSILFRKSFDALARFVETSDFFRWESIIGISFCHFVGPAFDATTESGVYNSGGFVVKNCRCQSAPWSSYRRLPVNFQGEGGSVGSTPHHLLTMKQLARAVKDEVVVELKVRKSSY